MSGMLLRLGIVLAAIAWCWQAGRVTTIAVGVTALWGRAHPALVQRLFWDLMAGFGTAVFAFVAFCLLYGLVHWILKGHA